MCVCVMIHVVGGDSSTYNNIQTNQQFTLTLTATEERLSALKKRPKHEYQNKDSHIQSMFNHFLSVHVDIKTSLVSMRPSFSCYPPPPPFHKSHQKPVS